MADNSYEKIIRLMQSQGAVNNSAEVKVGVMSGPKSCTVGELALSGSDLMIVENLRNNLIKGDVVAITRISEDCYAILGKLVGV